MKKKKLKISNLKIQSFVTSVKKDKVDTVKGGYRSNFGPCESLQGSYLGPAVCENTICPDRSLCDPACLTQLVEIC